MEAAYATDMPHLILLRIAGLFDPPLFGGMMFFAPCGQKPSLTIPICQPDLNHGWTRMNLTRLRRNHRS
jgi:hypothetical protein